MERDEVYSGKEEELVLTSLSNSYSELKAIFVSASRPFSCPTLHCLLITSTTALKKR